MTSVYVSSSVRPRYVVVALRGELDVCDVGIASVLAAVAAAPGSRIIVDLAELTFIDCGALSGLAYAREQALRAGGDLLLAAPPPPVIRLLSLTERISVLPVFASVEQAAND